ncbi:MAG: HPr family phosphocarrier protein [Gammaproteobacteria bacterium]|nr:MAG: HPr family phosphocarrier protein [Gammaproteobacteria bacterium]
MNCVEIEIVNKLGLHARASAMFVTLASSFNSELTLALNGQCVNAKSIMGIMMLAAPLGSRLELCAKGQDEHQAVIELSKLVNNRFGEPE